MFKTLKPKQGSVLVFSLIVLSILLSAAVAVATVSVANRRSTFSTAKSSQSFQVADSGAELVLQQIYKTVPTHASISALAAALGGGAACSGGAITKNGVAGGDIKVSFYDKDNNLISCTDTAWRSKVVAIKSEGTTAGTTRLVETAVAAGSDFGWVQIDGGGVLVLDPGYHTYYNYPSAARNPDQMCVSAGFLYATGACRTKTSLQVTTFTVLGSIMSAIEPSTRGFIACLYWFQNSYFDGGTAGNEILCAK